MMTMMMMEGAAAVAVAVAGLRGPVPCSLKTMMCALALAASSLSCFFLPSPLCSSAVHCLTAAVGVCARAHAHHAVNRSCQCRMRVISSAMRRRQSCTRP
jgi:hypothetical protein